MEMGNNLYKYIVYLTFNKVNGKIYVGVHKTQDPYTFDGYLGCGAFVDKPSSYNKGKTLLHRAILKYGVNNFKRITLFIYDEEQEALEKEKEIVTEEFLQRKYVYNTITGGGIPPEHKKPIYQFSILGELIQTFSSITEAYTSLNLSHETIKRSVQQKRPCKNWIFSFTKLINIKDYTFKSNQGIYQYNKFGELLHVFNNLKEASDILEIDKKELTSILYNKTCKFDCYFLYANENIDEYLTKQYLLKRECYLYSLDKEYINTFSSCGSAAKFVKGHHGDLSRAIKNNKPYKGFYWSYIKEEKLPNITYYEKPAVKIAQYDKDGNLIKIWKSINECKKAFPSCIKVCRGSLRKTKGYIFKYVS